MRYLLFIIIILFGNTGICQDFMFKWQMHPSLSGETYTIIIEKKDTKAYITIKETGRNDYSIIKRIKLRDCDSLTAFLDKYEFQNKGNVIYGPIRREYNETKILPDTNWIQINGDSLRRELIWVYGYYFDKSNNKCYSEFQSEEIWTDGTTYYGEYVKCDIKKTFEIHSCRISALDYKLDNMMYFIAIKYDKTWNYIQLRRELDINKPRNIN